MPENRRLSDACPNPKGMTVEFPQEVIETRSWRLKGVGAYGSDVNVVALDEYQDLAHAYKGALETLTRWAESAIGYRDAALRYRDAWRSGDEVETGIARGALFALLGDLPVGAKAKDTARASSRGRNNA